MNRNFVSSSDIRSIGYNEILMLLEIEFNSGGLYQYINVPQSIYSGLMRASSKGTFFHQFIRGRYGDRKIN